MWEGKGREGRNQKYEAEGRNREGLEDMVGTVLDAMACRIKGGRIRRAMVAAHVSLQ